MSKNKRIVVDPLVVSESIYQHFQDVELDIQDIRGDGEQFILFVRSDHFKGLKRLEQHRMVYKALEKFNEEQLLALDIKTAEK